jgi:Xaa-Pro aminopeptidase
MEESLTAALKGAGVVLQPYDRFYPDLQTCQRPVCADKNSANVTILNAVNDSGGKWIPSPLALWKAVKNAQEIAGERSAHVKDGVAMVNFLYWLKHLHANRAGVLLDEDGNAVTELTAAARLEQERALQEGYVGPSFAPIIAAGAHGAIVHYSATDESAAELTRNQFVLMDTGGQYLDGTTDITRTVALGAVSGQMKSIYTAVLCGHLDLTHALFAKGCRGENLDVIARMPIWKKGYDYQHGTGHGVGCYLNVHEGPVSIRTRIYDDERNSAVFEPGMITSNEPGVYVAGEFGVRLENMLVCVERTKTDYQTFYGFEPLTLVPFDKDALLLEEVHRELLNQYHLAVYQALSGQLEPEVDDWLFDITRPIR